MRPEKFSGAIPLIWSELERNCNVAAFLHSFLGALYVNLREPQTPTRALLVQNCRAAFPLFFSYEPKTQVTDHAAIDMDQKDIETEITSSSLLGFNAARRIYTEGGHSRSYAALSLLEPVSESFRWGAPVTGYTKSGAEVTGTIEKDIAEGNDVLWFLYDVSNQLGNHVGCQVGGTSSPLLDGCLADSGIIKVGLKKIEMNYTYDPMTGNRNGRRFDKFSTEARDKMYACDGSNCPYTDFMKFTDYYGHFEYADTWIRAAFEGLQTDFSNGNADFSHISRDGRAEAVLTATTVMSLWMYIIREMESSINSCVENCGPNGNECENKNAHAWDQAVAFYVGSLERGSGGYLQYSLANRMCLHFGTCGYSGVENTGTSSVNFQILKEFEAGQENILLGRCKAVEKNKERIVELLTIPLVQATIRQAHLTNHIKGATDKEIGEGATFAAAVLPLVHACSTSDAEIIYDNMRIGRRSDMAYFEDVKNAFERNYYCMGITCDDVGGIIDKRTGGYYDDTQPCTSARSISNRSNRLHSRQESGGSKAGLVVGILVAVCAFFGGLAFIYHSKLSTGIEYKGKASDLELNQESESNKVRYIDDETATASSPTSKPDNVAPPNTGYVNEQPPVMSNVTLT